MQQYCEFPTPKGVMRGFFHRPDQKTFPVLLIFHGFTGACTGTKFSYVQLSRLLEKQGVGVLRMDFLGSGESDLNFVDMTFDDELSCARLLLEEMSAREEVSGIYVLGHSMGGAIASELAKLYPEKIERMVLWAPAFNLPSALEYLTGQVERADTYDHRGYEISDAFVEDLIHRDLYADLDIYQNPLMVIHGTKDMTVPYKISEIYRTRFHEGTVYYDVKDGDHNFDRLDHIRQVITLTYHFFADQ